MEPNNTNLLAPYNNDLYEFNMYQTNIDKYTSSDDYYCGGNSTLALKGGMQITNTPLSEMFFGEENLKKLQKQIKREVYNRSDKKIKLLTDQDPEDLIISMRAVFFDHGKNLPNDVIHQVKILNKRLITYIITDLMTNVIQYVYYLRDINNPLKIHNVPLDANHAGRKRILPSYTTVWNKH
jgi:hypothetical protein